MSGGEFSQNNEKFIRMTSAPVERVVFSLAVPSIAIMLISSLYNVADTYFVSSLGTSQAAAVGVAFPLMAIIQAMGFFFGQGSGNFMARALGARDVEGASCMAATGLVSGFVVMAAIAGVGIAVLGSLTGALGATPTITPFAEEYILFILLASPWMVAATVLNQQLRFQGNAAVAMTGMLSGAVLNIFLDPLFIFVFRMGVKGAAIATMISQIVSFCILFFYGSRRKGSIPVRLRHFSPSAQRYAEMFRGGVPALLRQSLMSVASVVINHFARPYGDAAIAAISISNRIAMFATSVVLGFGQGFQPVCGFNYGAKLYSRVRKSFWFCVRFCCGALFVISIVIAVFAPRIIALFRRDDLEVIAIGALGLRFQCVSLPFTAAIIMINMMTQTMGKALEASVIALSRQGLFLLPSLFVLAPFLGLNGIQLARPVSELASLVVVVPIMLKVLKVLSAPDGTGGGGGRTVESFE
ncbi:MAG: MATE family efflux transporter [Treponema sp.]|jgi:putative MATE family efflux protein|nr:MATE family efflux transporter [Treponema sp.]